MKLMKTVPLLLLLLLVVIPVNNLLASEYKLDLSGEWQIQLDSTDRGLLANWHNSGFNQAISLPGTTDDAGLGVPNQLTPALERPQVLRLTRKNSYVGPAWYTRTIQLPKSWKNKNVTLKLERVIWETRVWVDGKEVDAIQESLSAPHYFDLTDYLSNGVHRLTIRVDNRKKYDITVHEMAHAYTDETQIKWNGVIGEIAYLATDPLYIDEIQVYPDVQNKLVRVKVDVVNKTGRRQQAKLQLQAGSNKEILSAKILNVSVKGEYASFETQYPMGESPQLWNEFNPALYSLSVGLANRKYASERQVHFGMRELAANPASILLNGQNIFLRGTLECAIFPLKGYPPMEKKEWMKLLQTARNWGLNHLRFHSWCPPKAAFEAADEMGFYLQVELPLWSLSVNKDEPTNQFLFAEADRIIREYGNHPSFAFWSLGNELQPDFEFLNAFVDRLKEKDSRRLYTNTSFTFENGHGKWPERNDDFFITQYTDKGWVRGQGVFDTEAPSFNKDYSSAVEGMPVPLITHEIGQYAVYPNLDEIKKYTGVLDPLNFKAVKEDLIQKGRLHKARDYMMASGKLAALLYKEEIERAMKTKGVSGFQLLDLHDFPGQGTALVGLLDAFWDSKNLIEADRFREFCGPVVPLIHFEKATYTNNEIFEATVEVVNYGPEILSNKQLVWTVKSDLAQIGKGVLPPVTIPMGTIMETGRFSVDLSKITKASRLLVELSIENSNYRNSWEIWVYPEQLPVNADGIVVTSVVQEALSALKAGKKVLFSPTPDAVDGVEGKFVQVFWSPVHFPNQPGTMGLLLNPDHPAFNHFPTDMHTNWQWWDLCKQSKTMVTDSIEGITPLVENVDNFMKNRQLCSVFEARSGNGALVFSSMDILSDLENRPVARQLLHSLLEYMKSDAFKPSGELAVEDIMLLIK
jgi:hypothetical protein